MGIKVRPQTSLSRSHSAAAVASVERAPPTPHSQGLTQLLTDNAPAAVREVKFESYFGRKVAVDASMHLYQFMARSCSCTRRVSLTAL